MEKLLRPYDKECMRVAMLKHEETFKEQVYELHRLYRIQKTLMKSIESTSTSSRPNGKIISNQYGNYMHNQNSRRFDLEHPADDDQRAYNVVAESSDHGNNRVLEVIDESEIELTLGPTRYMPPRKKKHGTDSDSAGPSFSSSSTESSHIMNRTSTTSMSMSMTKQDKQFHELGGLLQIADITLGYQNGGKKNTNIDHLEEQLMSRQERLKQPTWLYQVLSMNMT